MDQTSSAIIGRWKDYTTGSIEYTATPIVGYVSSAFVAIWLGLSVKYLKKLIASIAVWFHLLCHKPVPPGPAISVERTEDPTASSPLLTRRNVINRDAQALTELLKAAGGVRNVFEECLGELFWKKEKTLASLGYRLRLLGFTIALALICGGMIVAGVYTSRVKASGPARLDAEKCGLWIFSRENGGNEAATRAGVLDLEKETRAAEYAQNCYGTPDAFDAIRCDFLYRPKLSFSPPEYSWKCPFDESICGQSQLATFKSVKFTTEITDASDLGINAVATPKFRRSTECAPLNMNYPFIQNQTQNETTTYYYYYGEKPGHEPPVNYTYNTTGDPFERLAPVYDVFAYTTNSTDTESYWEPRPELTHPEYSTLTLIFVSSLRILYERQSHDPIFPADEEYRLPGEQVPWFRNSDPKARPFACINQIEVCLGDGKTCWPMNSHIPKDVSGKLVPTPPEFWLMYASLLKTDIYNSIEKRLGRALIAQSKVSQYFSEPLDDDHWVQEIERLVATSHARTQIDTWSIASGEDAVHEGKDGYILITSPEVYGDLCGIFKYNPQDYVSLRFVVFCTILGVYPFLWILSWRWETMTYPFRWVHSRNWSVVANYWPFHSTNTRYDGRDNATSAAATPDRLSAPEEPQASTETVPEITSLVTEPPSGSQSKRGTGRSQETGQEASTSNTSHQPTEQILTESGETQQTQPSHIHEAGGQVYMVDPDWDPLVFTKLLELIYRPVRISIPEPATNRPANLRL